MIIIGFLYACRSVDDASNSNMSTDILEEDEIQLTTDPKGHFLHTDQAFSPDDRWLVYDTRNDDTHIAKTCCIEKVNIDTGDIIGMYKTDGQTEHGPGVGAVTFNPKNDKILFIHGLSNCSESNPYSYSRRTGVCIREQEFKNPIFLDARDVKKPYTPGALRGGTHAHSWSADGKWVSFTYNDDIMTKLAERPGSVVKDLRMVGVMAPLGGVKVDEDESGENVSGTMFSVIVTKVWDNPQFGTNQIDKAYGDAWIGSAGYTKPNGTIQNRAIAFLGDTRNMMGETVTEVFRVDIPEDITVAGEGQPIEGTEVSRPMPPRGTLQQRLTFSNNRSLPGVQGPRHRVQSLPDGSMLLFMMRDKKDIVQLYGISPNGGEISQITYNPQSIETNFDVSPDGKYVAYGIDQQLQITTISTGKTVKIKSTIETLTSELRAINWSNNGKLIAYNRKVTQNEGNYFQVIIRRVLK